MSTQDIAAILESELVTFNSPQFVKDVLDLAKIFRDHDFDSCAYEDGALIEALIDWKNAYSKRGST